MTPARTNCGAKPNRHSARRAPTTRNPTWIITNSDARSLRSARARFSASERPPLRRCWRLLRSASAWNGWLMRSRSEAGCSATPLSHRGRSLTVRAAGIATAIPASSTPNAAMPEMRKMPPISASPRCGRGSRVEYAQKHRFAPLREVIHVDGLIAGGGVEAGGVALRIDARLLETEQLLKLSLVVLQTGDLGDADDLARPAAHALCLDHDVDRGRDLLLYRASRQIRAGHQNHRLEPAECIVGSVGVDGAHRALVPGVHGLQHVQGLAAAALADDDPVGTHSQCVAHEIADLDDAFALDVRRPRLQPYDVCLTKLELRGVFDGDDALVGGNEAGQDVQQRRLARRGPARDQDAQPAVDRRPQELHHVLGGAAHLQEVGRPKLVSRKLPDRETRAVDGQRRKDDVDSRAVAQSCIAHRRALVDPPAHGAHDPVDDLAHLRRALEDDRAQGDAAGALDVDLLRVVDHDLGRHRVLQQGLEWTESE